MHLSPRRHGPARLAGLLCVLLLVAAVLLPAWPAVPAAVSAATAGGLPRPAVLNRYDLDVTYDPTAHTFGGTLRLKFTNNTRDSLPDLWFHLYPNAPQYQHTATPGSLKLSSVTVDGQAVTPEPEAFHVRLALPRTLAPGESASVEARFTTTIPVFNDRFGYTGTIANLGGWFPILAAYDGGWRRDAFIDLGDPYYSEVAAYHVALTAPAGYIAAHTGSLTSTDTVAGGTRSVFDAENVRDFTLAISPKFDVIQRDVAGTTIRVYAAENTSDAGAAATLDAAAAAVRSYSDLFGAYPYPDLAVVNSFEGMEYPQLVLVGAQYDEFTIAHEVAHQWWYGVVGNDELHDLWDEALTSYSTLLYYEQRYGADRFQAELQAHALAFRNQSEASRAELCVGCDLYYYRDRAYAYTPGIYRKGAAMFHALRRQVGDDAFFGFLRAFYRRYQYATATWGDLTGAASDSTGRDLSGFFQSWLPAGAEG